MNKKIEQILNEIHSLEEDLAELLHQQQDKIHYQLKGKKIEFEVAVKQQHRKIKEGLVRYIAGSQLKHIISAPFIYAIVFPMLLLDIVLFIYQHICFRLYGIKCVERGKYIVFDHHQLSYLNLIQKFNCLYCSYGNGLLAYACEIASLTEQYWCPIKHATKILDNHKRYPGFLNYGDGEEFREKAHKLRSEIIATDKP